MSIHFESSLWQGKSGSISGFSCSPFEGGYLEYFWVNRRFGKSTLKKRYNGGHSLARSAQPLFQKSQAARHFGSIRHDKYDSKKSAVSNPVRLLTAGW
jgi:hypothetical protein